MRAPPGNLHPNIFQDPEALLAVSWMRFRSHCGFSLVVTSHSVVKASHALSMRVYGLRHIVHNNEFTVLGKLEPRHLFAPSTIRERPYPNSGLGPIA